MHLVVLGFLKTNVAGPAPHDLRTHSSTSHLTHPMAPAHAWSPEVSDPEAPKGLPTQTNEIHQPHMGGSRVCMPFRMSHKACPGDNVHVIGCLKAGHRSCSNVSFLGCLGPRHMRVRVLLLLCGCLCVCSLPTARSPKCQNDGLLYSRRRCEPVIKRMRAHA